MTNENLMIDDKLFTCTDLSIDNPYPYHSLVTTKVMNGTSYDTLGEWNGIVFKATIHKTFEDPAEINEIIKKYHGTFREIFCPYVCDELFKAYVTITKELLSPNIFSLELNIKEVGNEKDYIPVSDVHGFIFEKGAK